MIDDLHQQATQLLVNSLAFFSHSAFVASFEPRDVSHALSDPNWVNAMHEELENFERNLIWDLSLHQTAALYELSGFSRINKVRMGWKEGIDYEETFAHVAHLEAIRILLSFAASNGFKLQQMNVKSDVLNGYIEEEQAPRDWYARLKSFLLKSGFVMGSVDKTLSKVGPTPKRGVN
ncbi:LOW QUALITY PROTEIN: hypothetical protein U9M48_013831 [Paspalum notatum var. saurae]|uniref:Reverse transcriptase Ty1/copia-type domain-containing protein n=1 Tax=Paspalum notatum var. saurae TaxID=547442 RepID=A0AAQ3WJY1_PASNO